LGTGYTSLHSVIDTGGAIRAAGSNYYLNPWVQREYSVQDIDSGSVIKNSQPYP
jgi:hypothetical protein